MLNQLVENAAMDRESGNLSDSDLEYLMTTQVERMYAIVATVENSLRAIRYSSGDLVMWIHDLKTEKTGIILEIYNQRLANRLFPHAKIYVMGEEKHEEVMLSSLTNISKK